MFRELSRKRKGLTKEECISILKEEKRGVLSVLGDNGYPYGMPMNHYYNEDDDTLSLLFKASSLCPPYP